MTKQAFARDLIPRYPQGMGAFSKLKDMYQLQKKAKAVKKKLKNIHIESESDGVTIVLNGELQVVSVAIRDDMMADKKKLEEAITKTLEKGLKKAQEIAGGEMKDVWSELGVPGVS